MILRTSRSIKAGEELLVSYVMPFNPIEEKERVFQNSVLPAHASSAPGNDQFRQESVELTTKLCKTLTTSWDGSCRQGGHLIRVFQHSLNSEV